MIESKKSTANEDLVNEMNAEVIQGKVILPLRDLVPFPGMVVPLFVGREQSVKGINSLGNEDMISLVTQKNPEIDNPKLKDLFKIGVEAKIVQLLRMPDDTLKLLIEAVSRVKIMSFNSTQGFFSGSYTRCKESMDDSLELHATTRILIEKFQEYAEMHAKINPDTINNIISITNPQKLSDAIISLIDTKIPERQKILEQLNINKRVSQVLKILQREIGFLKIEHSLRNRFKEHIDTAQRNYYLNEKLRAIQKELTDSKDGKGEFDELEEKINTLKFSPEAKQKAESELKKLKMMTPMAAEASITRNYLETLLSLPWYKYTTKAIDLKKAQAILDKAHYGLEKIKERVLEYIAVKKRMKTPIGQILCFVGPPGVGKTSFAKAIAEALGLEFARFSLGGLRDEAEIRGHRRTYVGAMPGRLIQLIKKAATSNPVILLDEIDKMSHDFRGDPASALLEVLDPEQNNKFIDHYMEVEFDLSKVVFIATANDIYDIPPALYDRLEVIFLSGYTEDEKLHIARDYILAKQMGMHGLQDNEMQLTDTAIIDIIRYYTREAGVRSLEKQIAKCCRKIVKQLYESRKKSIKISNSNLKDFLGVRKYDFGKTDKKDSIGVTNGLSYSEAGGDVLSIEALTISGKSEIILTGKLGDVMQESAQAAFSYFRSRCLDFGVIPPFYKSKDIHIHVPEGAVPKEGPSAGVAIFISIVSVMTRVPVKKNIAMTGEITLRGRVLAIGGLKEKLLAALRGGVDTVLIPKDNVKDLEDIPTNVKSALKIIPISHADEAIEHALARKLKPVLWDEDEESDKNSTKNNQSDSLTH